LKIESARSILTVENRGTIMFRPVWAFAGAGLLGTVGIAGAVIVASSGDEEEIVHQVETAAASPLTPGPGVRLFRWGGISLLIPDTADLLVLQESTPTGSLGVRITRDTVPGDDIVSTTLIDAENGTIVSSAILEEDRFFIDAILATLTVSELDTATASWPYNASAPPDSERQVKEWAPKFSFLPPGLDTGFHVYQGIGDPGGEFIGMTNGRSTVVVSDDLSSGQLLVEYHVDLEEDRAPLERWVAEVKMCGSEIECS
jgi:hypothetical protein